MDEDYSLQYASDPTLRPGSDGPALGRIDQYDLVRKLGGGGFGVVYLARDTVSGIDVALKTLHPLLKSNPEEMEALRAKFALVSRLSHPNIASALVLHPCQRVDVWDETVRRELRLVPGDFVMVMRYAPGVTLSKWRRQFPGGVVPLDQALEIGRQIASALDYAHGERIVHRDIKPANVMVETLPAEASRPSRVEKLKGDCGASSPGEPQTTNHFALATSKIRVRILDFGLAAEIRSSMSRVSTETGDTSGTRPYMAPEQWLGKKQDGRTDQYALACVLYELLSGAPPFAGVFETGDPIIMRTAVERDAPEEIEGVSPAVNAALLKALAKNPKERFASCAEFVESCLAQSSQRESHTEARRHGWTPQGGENLVRHASSVSDAQDAHRPNSARPEVPPHQMPDAAAKEADVLRRKLALTRDLKAMPEAVRTDKEFSKFVSTAEDEMAVAEEACKFGRFAAAAESLARAETALDELRKAREKAKAERLAREKAKAERLAREKAKAERLAREKAEAERKAREERERKARVEAERKAKADAERKARKKSLGKVVLAIVAFVAVGNGVNACITRSLLVADVRKNDEQGKVQLWEGGPYWATWNIGADKLEDSGLYFWWGDTVGYRREGGAWVASDGSSRNFKFSEENTPTYGKDDATLQREGWITSAGVLAPKHDATHVHWGGGWRMPTVQELGDLGSKCDWTWTTVNGVKGHVVKGRGAYAGACIFLPAAGYGYGTSLTNAGSDGGYWSSVPRSGSSRSRSWILRFYSGGHDTNDDRRDYGQSVRPVLGFAE